MPPGCEQSRTCYARLREHGKKLTDWIRWRFGAGRHADLYDEYGWNEAGSDSEPVLLSSMRWIVAAFLKLSRRRSTATEFITISTPAGPHMIGVRIPMRIPYSELRAYFVGHGYQDPDLFAAFADLVGAADDAFVKIETKRALDAARYGGGGDG